MFNYIKGLINKKEIARIKELELENQRLQKELLDMTDHALDMHLALSDFGEEEELSALEAKLEKCSCGGHIMPMYDEYPNWIKFCNKCDARTEDSEMSPIVEPA